MSIITDPGTDPQTHNELPPPPKYHSTLGWVRHLLFGKPLPTSRLAHEKLPKFLALPIFSSDALSSNAYSSEAILGVLMIAAANVHSYGTLNYLVPISLGISLLMWVVVLSYQQIIYAYPDGGGAYPVSRDNLGTLASLIAAASLLIDYVLTVATSIAAGVAAVITAMPHLHQYLVPMCLWAIVILTIANLRGVKEAGWLFAAPAYIFILSIIATVIAGMIGIWTNAPYIATAASAGKALHATHVAINTMGILMLLQAFSQGCTALTGVEAISNTVPLFKEPRTKNASETTLWMGFLAVLMFLGLSILANHFGIKPIDQNDKHYQSVVGQVANYAWPPALHWMFYVVQYSTAIILIIAANAAYAGFPQLASMLARDGFMPRQLANLGDRLSFANGIVILALAAAMLVFVFKGIVDKLLSLYAIGVFTSFTLAQYGMVLHWMKEKGRRWQFKLFCNALGAIATGAVTIIIAVSKFTDGDVISPQLHFGKYYPHYGAWLVIVLVPIFVWMFYKVNTHYKEMRKELALDKFKPSIPVKNVVLVLVPRLHRGIVDALNYAKLISNDTRAVYMEIDPASTRELKGEWEKWAGDIPLVIIHSPFRSLVGPLIQYIDAVQRERNDEVVTVVIPELVPHKWWHVLLHNQAGPLLRVMLATRKDVILTSVRYFLEH